jgi:hypothetical protein
VLGAVNALRLRFDRAFRAAWRALTAPLRNEDSGNYMMAGSECNQRLTNRSVISMHASFETTSSDPSIQLS